MSARPTCSTQVYVLSLVPEGSLYVLRADGATSLNLNPSPQTPTGRQRTDPSTTSPRTVLTRSAHGGLHLVTVGVHGTTEEEGPRRTVRRRKRIGLSVCDKEEQVDLWFL